MSAATFLTRYSNVGLYLKLDSRSHGKCLWHVLRSSMLDPGFTQGTQTLLDCTSLENVQQLLIHLKEAEDCNEIRISVLLSLFIIKQSNFDTKAKQCNTPMSHEMTRDCNIGFHKLCHSLEEINWWFVVLSFSESDETIL